MTIFRTIGVRTRERTAATAKTTTIGPRALPTAGMKVIEGVPAESSRSSWRSRLRQARDGEPGDDLADLVREARLGRRFIALRDRIDDDPADAPHLVRTEAAGCGRRRP